MTKLKVFSLLPALLLASIAQAWEAPEIRELSAAEIQPKHESLQPHKSLVVQLDPTFGIRALALSAIFLSFPKTGTASPVAPSISAGERNPFYCATTAITQYRRKSSAISAPPRSNHDSSRNSSDGRGRIPGLE